MASKCFLVCNPNAGDATARSLVDQQVLPRLRSSGVEVVELGASEDIGREVLHLTSRTSESDFDEPLSINIVVAGGDGTVHEIVNSLIKANLRRSLKVVFTLLPCGTANALFFSLCPESVRIQSDKSVPSQDWKLLSLDALLTRQGVHERLTIAKAIVDEKYEDPIFGVVVASSALHASILHDSEDLRASIPDISRFKIAAEKNIDRWYDAEAVFFPPKDDRVTIYDPRVRKFVPFSGESQDNKGNVTMLGPFSYFLSTVNVDRLEANFVISPLQRDADNTGSMLAIIIRPKRDPANSTDRPRQNQSMQFGEKVMKVLHAAYDNGKHIHLGYDSDGSVISVDTVRDAPCVVEYIKCGGWRLSKTSDDSSPSLLCVDGKIISIKSAESRVHADPSLQFFVAI